MDAALMAELRTQLSTLGTPLMGRARELKRMERYFGGDSPLPAPIVKAKVTKAYKMLMPMATAPWASVIVRSVQDRLAVVGVSDNENQAAADACWGVWQDNQMDSEQKLAHQAALLAGRAHATVWPDDDGDPEIILDGADQMIVQYREGSRRNRQVAMRHWIEGDRPMATLYRPEGIYKFQGPRNSSAAEGTQWEAREVPDEPWPLPNPLGVVPVVELAVNRRLVPGSFGYAHGEYEHVTGLLDRINLLTFLGLVVAFWMGFPLRAVIGDKILRDDDGKPMAPFEVAADSVAQFENPGAKLDQFAAADRGNLSIVGELAQLAYLTSTPAHYFPLETGLSNISADTIRALEGGQDAKVDGHQGSLGDGHLEVLRLGGLMLDDAVTLSKRAQLMWKDSQSRSLAERADAAVKLKDILPPELVAEYALNMGRDEINKLRAAQANDAFTQLLSAAETPAPTAPVPAPAE
jgi:hypothetical protein